jgi:hypothetical protein
MMNSRKRSCSLLLVLLLISLSGFSQQQMQPSQPSDERNVQDNLPKSQDPLWAVLGKTKVIYDNENYKILANYPDEVKALAGQELTVSGFVLPLEETEKFKHFILSKRTPTCAFCSPGEPNEVIEVWLDKPIKWSEDLVKVKGTLYLVNDPNSLTIFNTTKDLAKTKGVADVLNNNNDGIFFKMRNASKQ